MTLPNSRFFYLRRSFEPAPPLAPHRLRIACRPCFRTFDGAASDAVCAASDARWRQRRLRRLRRLHLRIDANRRQRRPRSVDPVDAIVVATTPRFPRNVPDASPDASPPSLLTPKSTASYGRRRRRYRRRSSVPR